MRLNQMEVKTINLFVYLYTAIAFAALYFIYVLFDINYIYILSLGICICYVVSICAIIKIKGVASISCLFWICFFTFGISRLFFYVFGQLDFMNSEYGIIGIFKWEPEIAIRVLLYYFVFMMIFSCLTLNTFYMKEPYKNPIEKENILSFLSQAIYLIFYVSAPIVTIFYVMQVLLVKNMGYTSLYNGGIEGQIPFSGIFSIVRLAFCVSFYAIISFEKREKNFLTAAIIYLCISAILLVQGSRAELITTAFTFLVVYCGRFNKKFKVQWLLIVLIVGIPLLELVSYMRSGLKVAASFVVDSYNNFFTALSGSFNVPAYYLQNKEALSMNTYPYIFEPIVKLFQYYANVDIYSNGQTLEMIKIRYNLGHQLSYHVSEGYYLQGHNFASNFIAEMSEFGIIGVIIFSIIFSLAVVHVEKKILFQNAFFCFMSIEFCTWIFMAPRASAFYDTYNLFKYSLIYIVLVMATVLFKRLLNRRI